MEQWSYKVPTTLMTDLWDIQTDWNQTLMAKLNQISVGDGGEILIHAPKKFEELINSLVFYDKNTNKISDRYIVEFIDSDENIIYVSGSKLEITDY